MKFAALGGDNLGYNTLVNCNWDLRAPRWGKWARTQNWESIADPLIVTIVILHQCFLEFKLKKLIRIYFWASARNADFLELVIIFGVFFEQIIIFFGVNNYFLFFFSARSAGFFFEFFFEQKISLPPSWYPPPAARRLNWKNGNTIDNKWMSNSSYLLGISQWFVKNWIQSQTFFSV